MAVICLGELLIDFMALETGVSVGDASGFEKAPGGAPANVAVAIARMGYPAAFLGQVGDDPFGHYLKNVLIENHVNVEGLRFSADARTALAFVSLQANGERSFSFYRNPSADMLMQPADVAYDVIDTAKIFHYGSITLINEPARSATLAAVEYARQKGLTISYDPNLRLSLWENESAARQGMFAGLDYAHIVKVSEEELAFLLPDTPDNPAALWRADMQLIIVTRGEKGATLYTRDGKQAHHGGYSLKTVDTTGAGDSFVAALLSQILDYGDAYPHHLDEIVRFACAAGALTTTGRGAIPALPTRDQVNNFLLG